MGCLASAARLKRNTFMLQLPGQYETQMLFIQRVQAFLALRFDGLVRVAQQSISNWGDDRRRREVRMKADLEEDEAGKAEARKVLAGAEGVLRPSDKYGLVPPLAVTGHRLVRKGCLFEHGCARVLPRSSTKNSAGSSRGALMAGRPP